MVDERVNLDLQSAFGASLVGLRPKDEDYILGKSMNTAAGEVMDIAILLDGMGGGAAGERASESAGLAFADAWMLDMRRGDCVCRQQIWWLNRFRRMKARGVGRH